MYKWCDKCNSFIYINSEYVYDDYKDSISINSKHTDDKLNNICQINYIDTIIDILRYEYELYKLFQSSQLLNIIANKRNLTIFAPSDIAISKAITKLNTYNKKTIKNILLSHIVPNMYLHEKDLCDNLTLSTLGSYQITIMNNKCCDGIAVLSYSTLAKIYKSDIKASNGIVHIIDSMLL